MNIYRERGLKFEIWMEKLLKDLNYFKVRRNIEYHRKRYVYRQVDIEYKNLLNPFSKHVILELKYSSRGIVKLKRRNKKDKNGKLIKNLDNIVSETEERKRFCKASKGILVTNGIFDLEVHEMANYLGIKIWERNYLEKLDKKRIKLNPFSWGRDIEHQINSINPEKFNNNKQIVYI